MFRAGNLNPQLQSRLQSELRRGESLVWAGQPNPNRTMKAGFMLWVFFVPWTAFSLFWIAGASGFQLPRFDNGASLFSLAFPLFGLPFVLIGIGGLCAPLWLRYRSLSTIYAITDQRAITIEGVKSITVKSFTASEIGNVEKTEHVDGSGDLVLRTDQFQDSRGGTQTKQEGFFAVDDVRRVEQFLLKLLKAGKSQPDLQS